MADIAAALVPVGQVPAIWGRALPHLAPAFERGGDYSADDAYSLVSRGFWQLWIVAEPGDLAGAAVTSLEDYPQRRMVHVHAAGGKAAVAIPALWPVLREFAAASGCAGVRFFGRRGWARSGFLPAGCRHVSDVWELEV